MLPDRKRKLVLFRHKLEMLEYYEKIGNEVAELQIKEEIFKIYQELFGEEK